MAKAEGLPPTASVASVGPGIRYIGDNYAYAYSGKKIINSDNTDLLDFTTGSGFILANIEWGGDGVDSGQITYTIELNSQNVMYKRCQVAGSDNRNDFEIGTTRVKMLLPPFTRFVLNVDNATASNYDCTVWLTGRVYDA